MDEVTLLFLWGRAFQRAFFSLMEMARLRALPCKNFKFDRPMQKRN